MEWFLAAAGLIILIFAGDSLVKGAVNLALRLGVPALIVSLTIVAFGTSAPELLISVQSYLRSQCEAPSSPSGGTALPRLHARQLGR